MNGNLIEEIYNSKSKELNDKLLFLKLEIEKSKKDDVVDVQKIKKFLQKMKNNLDKDDTKKV